MATLYIAEYSRLSGMPNAIAQIPQEPPDREQTVAIGGASVASAAFLPTTKCVRLHTDAICSVKFGRGGDTADPAASATTQRMVAGQTEFKGVDPGAKVAVITNT